ncbi:hypothetical protein HII31_10935 [Pseudocercospora fuligena]|uniref:non-specific serine/threonine protein kinase n=1 Tax=Pseudocercospora fuligena TaxID=685502 RepID=A0A8H6RCN7_9PEZI|nr:hypothetical protein HII31_10935 [Pseudocercospora fuligena]
MANTDEADEIPKTDLKRFQDLEVAAWEWKGEGKKGGANGVRTHAKKTWNASTTDRESLSELLRTYDESRREVEALRDQTVPTHGDLGSSAVQHFAAVQSRRQYRDALANLIEARRANELTKHERAVEFLQQCQRDNDQALSRPVPANVELLARCKEEFDRCQNLALELPQDISEAENLEVFIDNCIEVLLARDELDEVLEVNYGKIKGSDEETNDAQGYLDSFMTQNEAAKKEIEQRMEESLTDTDKNLKSARANPPDADAQDVEAVTGYISYLTGVLDALNLRLVQIQGHIRMLERNSAIEELSEQRLKDFDETRRSIDDQLGKVNKNIAVRRELLSKLEAHQEIYGPDEEAYAKKENERKEAGNLKHGWVAVGSTDSGAQGSVQFWVKQNARGLIVDRIATKDTTGRPDPLDSKKSDMDYTPPEVACMYRLNKCAGSENIVRILNWRSDHTRAARLTRRLKGFLAYRIYVEYCGSGDLDEVICRYGYHDFDEPRTSWIPKPFVWATLEALAKAALLMKRGELDLSKKEVEWLFIVHGDLKPGNVFLGANTGTSYVNYPLVKVGDFGLAMENPYPDPDKFEPAKFDYYYRPYGTRGWMAPASSISSIH